jgi:hypothetical protein
MEITNLSIIPNGNKLIYYNPEKIIIITHHYHR